MTTIGSDFRTAAIANNSDVVRQLLDAGIDPDIPDSNGWTALMLTAKRGCPEVMELLLQRGAKVRQQNSFRKAAIDYAITYHQAACIDLLLKNERDAFRLLDTADYEKGYPVSIAVRAGDLETVDVLGKHFGGDNIRSQSAWRNVFNESLLLACREKQDEIVKRLVSFGADVNVIGANGWTPLIEAVAHKRGRVSLFLIQNGADIHAVTETGVSALDYARRHNMKRVIAAILKG